MTQDQILLKVIEKSKAIDAERKKPASKEKDRIMKSLEVERNLMKVNLNPLRLVATGISCTDCAFCVSFDAKYPEENTKSRESFCKQYDYEDTRDVREKGLCGLDAKSFLDVKDYTFV